MNYPLVVVQDRTAPFHSISQLSGGNSEKVSLIMYCAGKRERGEREDIFVALMYIVNHILVVVQN